MSNIESVLFTNPGNVSTLPFWPNGLARLILVLESVDNGILAHGFDADTGTALFAATLGSDQRDAFKMAVGNGQAGTPIDPSVSNQNLPFAQHTVVVGPPGTDPGPKFTIDLSVASLSIARTGT